MFLFFCNVLCLDTGHDEALNTVTMPMVNNDMCSQMKGDAGNSRICAGGRIGEGVCDVSIICACNWTWLYLKLQKYCITWCTLFFLQRDYGGPLVCQEHERKVIMGVSIQRTKCASSQPALFVNVAFYSEWIYKVFKLYPTLERNWWFGVQKVFQRTNAQHAKEEITKTFSSWELIKMGNPFWEKGDWTYQMESYLL